jgi:hypothetical protein
MKIGVSAFAWTAAKETNAWHSVGGTWILMNRTSTSCRLFASTD